VYAAQVRLNTASPVRLPTAVCRTGIRGAYLVLRTWWFVRRPDVQGVKCVLTDGERVLLVRHTYGNRGWDLPGGAVHRGEPPSRTATREMGEELGIEVTAWRELGQLEVEVDFRHDTMHLFQAEIGSAAITMDRCELAEVAWFPLARLPTEQGRFVRAILARL
jgi:8-oxo-dGTP pyrophosphatase MutT (NUDIX family)